MYLKSNKLILMIFKKQLETISDKGGNISTKLLYLCNEILSSDLQQLTSPPLILKESKKHHKNTADKTPQNTHATFLTKQDALILLSHLEKIQS